MNKVVLKLCMKKVVLLTDNVLVVRVSQKMQYLLVVAHYNNHVSIENVRVVAPT